MKLRFKLDQSACFRRGIDSPSGSACIEVNPADVPQEVRDLIADSLRGDTVMESNKSVAVAEEPTLDGLIKALKAKKAKDKALNARLK